MLAYSNCEQTANGTDNCRPLLTNHKQIPTYESAARREAYCRRAVLPFLPDITDRYSCLFIRKFRAPRIRRRSGQQQHKTPLYYTASDFPSEGVFHHVIKHKVISLLDEAPLSLNLQLD
jgi:hypothetical protein